MKPPRPNPPPPTLRLLTIACTFALAACASSDALAPTSTAGGDKTLPSSGVYFGVNLDWQNDSPAQLNQRLGHPAAVFVRFFAFPLSSADLAVLAQTVDAVAAVDGMLMVTLEPTQGLSTVSPESVAILGGALARANAADVPTYVRFAHEMNGSWYPWSQQPEQYVEAFRLVAFAVHAQAPGTAMLWAPNYGGGYPFSTGPFATQVGSPAFALLDTNSDGNLDMADDPYAPYYPGDDVVDWVGMSLYHWGGTYPWGENEIPEDGKFAAQLLGQYVGLNGDDTALPDFYDTYWSGRGKPIAIPETAAFYAPAQLGPDEISLKRAWWRQAFDAEFLAAHPGIKMINWFEWVKPEAEARGALIDWRALGSASVAEQFRNDLPLALLRFAP